VSGHQGWFHAKALPEARKRIFDHEDCRLGEERILQRSLCGLFIANGREEQLAQIVTEVRPEGLAAIVN
jgi:hypothetical protein